MKSEADLWNALRAGLGNRWGNLATYKLHGSEFQPGLPDTLIACPGFGGLIELKWLAVPTARQLELRLTPLALGLLTDLQGRELERLARAAAPGLGLVVLVGIPVDHDPGGFRLGELLIGVRLDVLAHGRARGGYEPTLREISDLIGVNPEVAGHWDHGPARARWRPAVTGVAAARTPYDFIFLLGGEQDGWQRT